MIDDYFGGKILEKIKKEFASDLTYVYPLFKRPLSREEVLFSFIGLEPIENNTLIIVNDHYRATPSKIIVDVLREAELIKGHIDFLIATGTHKQPPQSMLEQLTGKREGDNVFIHDSKDKANLKFFGETRRGTSVIVNRLIEKYDRIITINSVEPHYFAGFTGGVKSIFPGIAAYESVVQNHKWAMHPDSKIMRTKGNPVWEDLWDAGNIVKPLDTVDSIQLVNHGSSLFSVNTGRLPDAFMTTVKDAINTYGIKLSNPVDHVITIVQPPLDKNMYQSHKAIENTKSVIKDGGSLVLVAENSEGIGTEAFYNTIKKFASPEKILSNLTIDTYRFGDHKAYKWAETVEKIDLLYLGGLSEEHVDNLFMTKISEEELLRRIKEWLNNGETVVVDEMGGYSTLYLED